MKRKLAIFGTVLVSLLVIIGFFLFLSKGKGSKVSENKVLPSPSPKGKYQTLTLLDIPLEDRPYISLYPSNDGHWVTMNIDNIKKAETIDYEIIYEMTASDGQRMDQGVIGEAAIKGSFYNTGKRLLGSESAGKYKYDKDVEGKKLLIRLRTDDKIIKFETGWRLNRGGKEVKSPDEKFSLKGNLPNDFFIILNTGGVPQSPNGKIIAGPYGVFSSGSFNLPKMVELNFLLDQTGENNYKVFVWDQTSQKWEELPQTVWDKQNILSRTTKLGTFIVVSP